MKNWILEMTGDFSAAFLTVIIVAVTVVIMWVSECITQATTARQAIEAGMIQKHIFIPEGMDQVIWVKPGGEE